VDLVNTLVSGLTIGGLYALFAVGLSLSFGVMRLVNIAHGDFIVAGAYVAVAIVAGLKLPIMVGIVAAVVVMGATGYLTERFLLSEIADGELLRPLLITFGLSIMIQNGLVAVASADTRALDVGALKVSGLSLWGVSVGTLPAIVLAVAIVTTVSVELMLKRTRLGRSFRAVSDSREIASLFGLDPRAVFGLAMMLSIAFAGLAGALFAMQSNFEPASGPQRLLFAFEAVIIGGLGSPRGTLLGGLILGVVQAFGSRLDPGLGILAGHIAFFAMLLVRPQGFCPITRD
jgi:branched-chain amino acid transport system permease protein